MESNKDRKKIINTFLFADILALENRINQMNQAGYKLVSLGSSIVFERSYVDEKSKNNTVYAVSIHKKGFTTSNGDTPDVKKYRQMCAGIGWEFVTSHLSWQVFRTTAINAKQNPLIRDELTEYRRMRKSLIQMILVFCAIFLPFLISIIIDIFDSGYSQFLRNKDIVYTATAFVIGLLLLINISKEIYWIIREFINTKRQRQLNRRSEKFTKINKIFIISCLTIVFAMFPIGALLDNLSNVPTADSAKYITLSDMGHLGESVEMIPYTAQSSFFVPLSYSYMDVATANESDALQGDEAFVFTNVYKAKSDKIAQNIADVELKSSSNIQSIENLSVLWGNNITNGYYINGDKTSILLNNNNIVVVIRSSFDLSQPENISKCIDALSGV